jgi:ferredoxin-nitrate reductase
MFSRQSEVFESRDSIGSIWGYRSPYRGEGQWPACVDERTLEDPERWVQSACVLCSNGCGLDIGVKDGCIIGVRGRSADRVSHGRLGPKGMYGWVANGSPDRLTRPLIRIDERLREATWQEAMALIVERSREIQDRYTSLAIAFYTGGQLFLEEYYTLAVIGKGGLGTPHMDASTRLSSATASAALMESFGTDGSPGSYTDIDTTDAILHLGHNVAEQHTVLWMRILDRRHGSRPPGLVVIDPRDTPTAQEADVHLAPRPGTNLAVMNGLLNLVIQAGWVDRGYIDAHTVGFAELKETVARWPLDRVEEVTGVPVDDLRAAAQILGTAPTLVSTVLQGVYQSRQATAAAVQANNLHLIRGLIGRPGCGILQMHGQPAGQNVAETGCAGSFPAYRNWANPQHMAELARLWDVDPQVLPAWGPPTHIMQILRHIEQGSIRMLWVIGTNPAVSLPDLLRIRRILSSEGLFLVVQDAFLTETAELADVVLPAAMWGEKTGTYTSADRTVHISHTAVSPPGQARPDLDVLLEYAGLMDLRDRDGDPLIKWRDPEGAFEAWKACSRGRPCDYTGLSYARLSDSSGIQWPCGAQCAGEAVRLYADGLFNTDASYAQSYGHDLLTGSELSAADYCLRNPHGRAILKAADYVPSLEEPDEEYPLWLTTGRVVYQWQTRTKTARSKKLNEAAPDAFVQISEQDAARYRIAEGQMVEVRSRRGYALAPARLGGIEPGVVFMPFHYGYWDDPGRSRAANELTLSEWDPVSKQPHLKYATVRIRGIPSPTLADTAHGLAQRLVARVRGIFNTGGTRRVRFQIRRPVAGERGGAG